MIEGNALDLSASQSQPHVDSICVNLCPPLVKEGTMYRIAYHINHEHSHDHGTQLHAL